MTKGSRHTVGVDSQNVCQIGKVGRGRSLKGQQSHFLAFSNFPWHLKKIPSTRDWRGTDGLHAIFSASVSLVTLGSAMQREVWFRSQLETHRNTEGSLPFHAPEGDLHLAVRQHVPFSVFLSFSLFFLKAYR